MNFSGSELTWIPIIVVVLPNREMERGKFHGDSTDEPRPKV